ncbi:autotransporter-associated N-terminal domain-containing protein [Leptotrichia shahii]|uniref:autotransporter-associated N-terminal domain-containing protein n=2 Tax=Leptotrichia TaxID=32067 RepID=UPI0028D3E8E1|nr:autotransporter-associated N-terminal domain-containing protein [Leptotrichia shahii]
MTKNLSRIKKDLKSFAKRVKDFKYTDKVLVMFLLTGTIGIENNLFSAQTTDTAIENQIKQINTSVHNFEQNLKKTKDKNNKSIKQSNLELIQLMEQGDHVIKSTWSNWQYATGEYYNSWNGTYKGKGDKTKAPVNYKRDPNSRFANYTGGQYNKTVLNRVIEPISAIPIDAAVRPKNIQKNAPTFTISRPTGALPTFATRTVSAPSAPADIEVDPPTIVDATMPAFEGGGFYQHAYVILHPDDNKYTIGSKADGRTFVSNFNTYKTEGRVKIELSNTTMTLPQGSGKLKVQTDVTNNYNPSGITSERVLDPTYGAINFTIIPNGPDGLAFINDLRDRDSTYEGEYEMTAAEDNGPKTRIFLSYNSVAGGHKGHYDATGDNKTKKALLKPNFKLILNGVSTASSSDKVLIGLEHQIIRQSLNANSTSFLDNQGEIILNSGKNLVGIMIDVEAINNLNHIPSITQNNGRITINSEKSVGIDYGSYYNLKLISALKIGNIDVNGTGNVGFRMFNIHPSNMNYFDNITADSGGSNKTILVGGHKNIGIAIVKSLSDSKNANPIANLANLNVTVDGGTDSAGDPISENVGFLRHKDYSDNNKKAMIFNSSTMGEFKFGSNAFKSTLIRSDKYDIELQKDITINAGHENGENTIGFANDDSPRSTVPNTPLQTKIINKARLTASNQKKFRGLVANGKNAAVENVRTGTTGGIISITGDKDESIGMAAIKGANLKTDGTIEITGKGIKKVGVYNDGDTAEIGDGSKITVYGSESAAIYNKKTTKITGNTIINAKNGTIGIFSTGSGKNVNFTSTNPSHKVTINVDDSGIDEGVTRGLAVYATDNSIVKIEKAEIDVKDGSAGLVATKGGLINIEGGKLKYRGEGFAMYTGESGSTGTINAKYTTVTLEGKAVGFEVTGNTSHVDLTGATVNINSDDVILMNVSNPSTLQLSNFDTTLNSISGLASIGGTSTKYKLAVITGLNGGNSFKINSLLDKNDAISNTTSQTYKFVRNILIQKSILDVDNDVKSILTSANAIAINEPAVYGLAISSTKGAITNTETGININGKTVTADRIDAGNGAIGLYTNFGTINIDNGGKVLVETDNKNVVNNRGVGIFAVNGSKVNNKGNIEVSGKESIGILGLAYRQNQAGNVVGNEFESVNEGKITINNYKNIVLNSANAKGIYIKNNTPDALELSHSGTSSETDNIATNQSGGVITMKSSGTSGNASVAMFAEGATIINDNSAKIDLQGAGSQIGMYGITNGTNNSVLVNKGIIIVGSSTEAVPNVAMYSDNANIIPEQAGGIIDIKDNSYGIYGKSVKMTGGTIKTADNGVGIFATGPTVNLLSGTINVGNKQSVGVFVADDTTSPVTTNVTGNVNMTIGNDSFGYVITSTTSGSQLITENSTTATVNKDSIYVYSANPLGRVINKTAVTSTGSNNYGLYGNGTMENYGTVDFSNGIGNVAIYSTGGTAINFGTVKIGASDTANKKFGIGMATGYYDEATDTVSNEGTVINRGTIEVSEPDSMGMYAVGKNSKAINYGNINLSSSKTVGMYLDRGAVGENWGTIQTTASGLRSVKGIYLANGSYIKNYGTIDIAASDLKSAGIWTDKAENVEENAEGVNSVTGVNQKGTSTSTMKVATADDMKEVGGVTVKVPPRTPSATVTDVKGNIIPIVSINTATLSTAVQPAITVTSPSGITTLDLDALGFRNFGSTSEATSFGMYIDTSGIRHTNPIQGLNNLAGLEDINLYFGSEASRYTTAKAIEVGSNIIAPYNDALDPIVTAGTTLNVTSANLTWMAQPTKNAVTGLLDKVYLVKVPYMTFAKKEDVQTHNFLAGLEERYGVESLGTREKLLFDKLNGITNGEGNIFAQAVDEMKGHQYANIQQRTNATGNALDKEFNHLRNAWRNPTKQNNKIKAFGLRDEYNTNTAGIIDYTSNAYGVAYVHEDEKIKMGNSSGWYAGAVTNRFKFKDIGKSKENQTILKAGVFKTMSPKKDYNGALQWTIGGDVFVGINDMKRRYLVVDDVFQAKSDYHSYGAALKTDLGYDVRLGERTHFRPYGALKMEYGRFDNIKEDSGEMRLQVKGNDYFSVKPEAGIEFKYIQPLAVKTNLSVGLTAAYENEIGKLQKGNQARVRYTTADWYNLEKEKEDKRGNGKFDLNIGVDNTRFGVTVNAGYDTKGNNIRGGIGFRAIY